MNIPDALANLMRQCDFGPFLDTSSPQYAALKQAASAVAAADVARICLTCTNAWSAVHTEPCRSCVMAKGFPNWTLRDAEAKEVAV